MLVIFSGEAHSLLMGELNVCFNANKMSVHFFKPRKEEKLSSYSDSKFFIVTKCSDIGNILQTVEKILSNYSIT